MTLQKQNLNINFAQGLDTKTDPWQVQPGKMLELENSIFTKAGLLQKRNGFESLTSLPNNSSTNITTFNGNLIALGDTLNVFNEDSMSWVQRGDIQPLSLSVIPAVRTSYPQEVMDVAIASNKLACIVYSNADGTSYYQIIDSMTGQIIISEVSLPSTSTMCRVFSLGIYFIITFLQTVSANTHLRYISIPINNPSNPNSVADLSTQVSSLSAGYDGQVYNNTLYLSWSGSDIGGSIRTAYLTSTLTLSNVVILNGYAASLMSVTVDSSQSTPIIWATFWNSSSNNIVTVNYSHNLINTLGPTTLVSSVTIQNLTSSSNEGILTVFYETSNTYGYSSTQTDYISSVTCTQIGSVGSPKIILRSVGIASKSIYFSINNLSYLLVAYSGSFQPTYFLIDQNGNIISKLAYSNGNGYSTNQILPQLNLSIETLTVGYLIKTQLIPVNKSQGISTPSGVYAQTGINIASFTFNVNEIITASIGNNLLTSGGIIWAYDGVKPVEQNFNVWPEDIAVNTSTSGGSLSAQQYYYYVTYEWTDGQGNLHRSAPSIPMTVTTTGATSSNTLDIPTLRLTYKTGTNPVRIVIYRWSAAQPISYQITSVTSPTINDPTVDSITYVDTQSDSDILGNMILYTTGGVVENIGPPSCTTMTLFKSRLMLVDSEDQNLIWYSKQVIESTPVEMSDLFTIYIAPTISYQGSTGNITALSALDDKLIIFKENAIYYITGSGPDNTGSNNDFSDPIFITATVGCNNQQSIVFIPNGLLFQSTKGIWILGRDLSTQYIGAPVEKYNGSSVTSAVSIPDTNQVRFTLDNGVTLMYDYYYNQWGTFSNVNALSSTIYQNLHTYLNSFGNLFQESPGVYLDGVNPVLMNFSTSWFNLSGVQGYERAYFFYLLGNYLSPHKLQVQIAYDYNPYPSQTVLINPTNYNPTYGSDTLYGGSSPYGGNLQKEQWRFFFNQQKCQSFQISINEVFDSTYGTQAGAGLTITGIDLVLGAKSGYPRIPSANYTG